MDQFKEILGVLKRQHFWIIAPILLAIGIWGWMTSTKKLEQEFATNRQSVESDISKMKAVSSINLHPNQEYHDEMQKLIDARRANVRAAWEKKWQRQSQQLKWPDSLDPAFIAIVDKMRPIEQVDPGKVNIPSSMRRGYGAFIKTELPGLADRIGSVWAPTKRSGASFSRRNEYSESNRDAGEETKSVIVAWSPDNQALIQSRFDWGAVPPTTKQVLYAQEDLWVLTTLIDIIKRTNGDAVAQSQATIKEIEYIQLGASVTAPSMTGFRVVTPKAVSESESEGEDEEEEEEAGGGFDDIPAPEGGGDLLDLGAPEQQKEAILIKDRYYDENYEPIADKETLMDSVTVAKRIPVRIRVKMDQRNIHGFLAECANAPLTFEVRQLRFNPATAGRLGQQGSGFENALGTTASVKRLPDYQSFDRTVELFGIIYIFNPVDNTVLGIEEEDADVDEDDE